MSGILGIWNLDGRPTNNEQVASLSAGLSSRAVDGQDVWTQGSVGFAYQYLRITPESVAERQPFVAPSGAVVVFDGRLDNREELILRVGGGPGPAETSSDAAVVFAAYELFAERFAEHLNGDFALALFDPHKQQLLLARDAIGVRPLYYCNLRNTFVFASEIKAILAHPEVDRRPNDDALADLLMPGDARCRDLTCFRGIFSLVPGHLGTVTPTRRWTVRQYFTFDSGRSIRYKSFPEYAEAFRTLFDQAVRRRIRSAYPTAVSVSGGLDSSAILCAAENFKNSGFSVPAPTGISLTYEDGSRADEKSLLLAIERQYGIDIQRLPKASPRYLKGVRKLLWHVEVPGLDCQWNANQQLFHIAQAGKNRVLLSGFFGDQLLFGPAYLVDLVHSLRWGKAIRDLKQCGLWMTDIDPQEIRELFWQDLLRAHVPGRILPLLRRIRAKAQADYYPPWYSRPFRQRALDRALGQARPQEKFASKHAEECYQQANSKYHLNVLEESNKMSASYGLEPAYPFMDRDLISFIMAIPGEVVNWQGVPKGLFRGAMRGVLPEAIRLRRWKADFTDFVNEGAAREYPEFQSYFESNCLAVEFGYVDGDAVKQELEKMKPRVHDPHSAVPTWRIAALVSLELWLQVFFGQKCGGRQDEHPGLARTAMA
ncbi:MAG TPA: asparagine synthase-related protein [Terriglobales bacterium]|nr:asparagine synthase-related protein [Terriglobales bacterium]